MDSYSDELKSSPIITQTEIAKIAQVSPATVAKKYEDSIRAVAMKNKSNNGGDKKSELSARTAPINKTITQNKIAKNKFNKGLFHGITLLNIINTKEKNL